jgi:hypothetical protein
MSLSSLADQAIMNRETTFLQNRMKPLVTQHATTMLHKFNIPTEKVELLTTNLLPLAAEAPIESTKGSNALDSLVRYIPTEAITLYVAACSVVAALKDKVPPLIPYLVYWAFVFLTPLLFLIIFGGRRRSDGLPAFPPLIAWPWFTLVASTIAFGVWSLAIPGTPYLKGEVGGVLAAFLALFVSTFLTLLEPIFGSTARTSIRARRTGAPILPDA